MPTRRRLAWVALVLLAIGIAATARYPVFVDDISSPERAEVIDDIEWSQTWHWRSDCSFDCLRQTRGAGLPQDLSLAKEGVTSQFEVGPFLEEEK